MPAVGQRALDDGERDAGGAGAGSRGGERLQADLLTALGVEQASSSARNVEKRARRLVQRNSGAQFAVANTSRSGTPVNYGETIPLMHQGRKFLQLSPKHRARAAGSYRVVLDPKGSEDAWLTLHPRFKFRSRLADLNRDVREMRSSRCGSPSLRETPPPSAPTTTAAASTAAAPPRRRSAAASPSAAAASAAFLPLLSGTVGTRAACGTHPGAGRLRPRLPCTGRSLGSGCSTSRASPSPPSLAHLVILPSRTGARRSTRREAQALAWAVLEGNERVEEMLVKCARGGPGPNRQTRHIGSVSAWRAAPVCRFTPHSHLRRRSRPQASEVAPRNLASAPRIARGRSQSL